MNHFSPYLITACLAVIGAAIAVIRRAYRRMRDDDVQRVFVKDMATNHLPHIYDALKKLCENQGIELTNPPPIKWIEFNGRDK